VRTLGILGGLGPESTIDYYRSILTRFRGLRPEAGAPPILIHSLDVDKGIAMLNAGRLPDLVEYLSGGVKVLARAGVDFACIAANTPHIVFDDVQRRSTVPLVSIVRATADYAQTRGFKRVGLLGTGFTMGASFYPDEFARIGIAVIRPTEAERALIHRKYIDELLKNRFLPDTRAEILRIAQRMADEDGVQALVLAGTELPLLMRDRQDPRLDFLDTTAIHVEAIVRKLLDDSDRSLAQ
jgi:aspartate racemase